MLRGFSTLFGMAAARVYSGELEKINFTGSAKIERAYVRGATQFAGNLECIESILEGAFKGSGSASILSSRIGRDANFAGLMSISNSQFSGKLKIATQQLTIEESQMRDIEILISDDASHQVLSLSRTRIEGDVVFASGTGQVIMDRESVITGEIRGAEVDVRAVPGSRM